MLTAVTLYTTTVTLYTLTCRTVSADRQVMTDDSLARSGTTAFSTVPCLPAVTAFSTVPCLLRDCVLCLPAVINSRSAVTADISVLPSPSLSRSFSIHLSYTLSLSVAVRGHCRQQCPSASLSLFLYPSLLHSLPLSVAVRGHCRQRRRRSRGDRRGRELAREGVTSISELVSK